MDARKNSSRDHTSYAVIVKLREVRMEDGAIIMIDRERAERVAKERRG